MINKGTKDGKGGRKKNLEESAFKELQSDTGEKTWSYPRQIQINLLK